MSESHEVEELANRLDSDADKMTCYASTIAEHPPNGVALSMHASAALLRQQAERIAELDAIFTGATWYTPEGLWADPAFTILDRVRMAVAVCKESDDEDAASLKLVEATRRAEAAERELAGLKGDAERYRRIRDDSYEYTVREARLLGHEPISKDVFNTRHARVLDREIAALSPAALDPKGNDA